MVRPRRFVRRWRIATVYVLFVAAVAWGGWRIDQANAARTAVIRTAVITCGDPFPAPVTRPSFFD